MAEREGPGDVSRPPSARSQILAVDIGGTKLAVALVDGAGVVTGRRESPTPASDGELMYSTLLSMAHDVLAAAGPLTPVACGVGCGGPMAPFGLDVSPLNIPGWRRFPLRDRLESDLGLTVQVDNDAKALALGEQWCGAGRGVDNLMAMVVSTGVGGGIIADGRLLHGRLGNAGHIGHVIVEPGGAPCACGGRGCLESEISGPSIARRTGAPPADASLAERERAGMLLGRGVASVVNLLDLEVVLVGGSVALGFGEPFFDAAQRELSARAQLDFSRGVEIRPVGLGEHGPLVGAAAVARVSILDRVG